MKLGSLFSGIGGFEVAFESQGFSVAWQCEIDKPAQAVLRRHWPGVTLYEDVTAMQGGDVEPVDIITFGSPCQDLSVAGRRGGLAGERSGLFHEAVRLIAEMREATNGRYPTFALWENVPGALSSNDGWDFAAVYDSLADIGALAIGHRVLDAQFFGVPQRRRRIFLIADFGGHRAGEILALTEGGSRDTQASRTAGQDPAPHLVTGVGAVGLDSIAKPLGAKQQGWRGDLDNDTYVVANTLGASATYDRGDGTDNLVVAANGNRVVNAITAKLAKGTGGPSGDEGNHLIVQAFDAQHSMAGSNPAVVRPEGGPSGTLQANKVEAVFIRHDIDAAPVAATLRGGGHRLGVNVPVRPGDQTTGDNLIVSFAQNQAGDVYTSDVVGAIATNSNASGRSTAKISAPTGIRRLTPTECERLQGFEDGWTEGHADTHRYRMLGNSVAVPVVAAIAAAVRRAMGVSR